MKLSRTYAELLRLYPRDYRLSFAAEMLSSFEKAAEEHLHQRWSVRIRFVACELHGLMIAAAKEWIAKLTTDPSVRGRNLPDAMLMRPPGVTRELWFAQPRINVGRPHADTSKASQ